jgi:transposase
MLKDGMAQNKIAKIFNVSCSTICEIYKNKKWTNIKMTET